MAKYAPNVVGAPNFDNHIYKEINIKSLKMLAKINVFKSLERLKKKWLAVLLKLKTLCVKI